MCSPECALAHVRDQREKERKAETRRLKQKLRDQDRGWHLKKAQQAFNAFIRHRDRNKPCISCGRFHQGQYHAGHYRTTAAMSALRFNELNCHRQCAPCNNHHSGNITEYRLELLRRIGESLVEWLEKDHPPHRWTIDELKGIRQYYEQALKATPSEPEDF